MKQYHDEFLLQLSSTDSILHEVVMNHGVILLSERDNPFRHLVRIISGQQLSVKAAETIYGRVHDFFRS